MSGFTRALLGGVSRAAASIGLPKFGTKKAYTVTTKAGKKGQPFRRIVRSQSEPFLRQVGIFWRNGEAHPLMQRGVYHRVYHATKGWRTYTNRIPNLRRAAS